MHKSFGEVVDLRPQTSQQERPKRLPGLYPWLRFNGFFTRDDWIESFAINLESIDERAANAYLNGEAAFFQSFAEDYAPAVIGRERALEIKQRKLETIGLHFNHATTKLCQSPIEQLMLAGLVWTKYGCEKGLVEIWDSTSRCAKPPADVVIAPQYQIEKYRVDFAIFINVIANEEIKIAVECNGHWHAQSKEQVARDTKRDRDIQIGWKTPSFTGSEIWRDHEACAGYVSKLASNEIEAQLQRRGLK
jgi:very-short-patch-repair endonuclease